MKSIKRLLSLLLTAFLTLALFPLTAMAAPPTMSAEVDQFNRLIITFSERIYGNSTASAPLDTLDFQVIFTSNGGAATGILSYSVRTTGNGNLQGGETQILMYPSFSPTQTSGVETVEVKPADGASIYNAAGEPMSADATTGTLTLKDKQPPAFASGFPRANTSVAPGSKIVVLEVSPTEPAFVHYVGLAHGAAAPSKAQVLAGTDSAGDEPIVKLAGTAKVSGISAYTIDMPDHNTMYDFYVVLTDDANNTCDPVKIELTTPDTGAPVVTTGMVRANDSTSATLNGSVTATGGETLTQHGFVCGTASDPSLGEPGVLSRMLGPLAIPVGFATGISGLAPSTTYYVRAFATNSKGISYGNSAQFTTPATETSSDRSSDKPTYIPRDLDSSGVWLCGDLIHRQAELNVKTLSVSSLPAQLRDAASGSAILLGYDVSLARGFRGAVELSFPVGTAYEGQTVTILHLVNGVVKTNDVTVEDGMATVTVDSLSPFAVVWSGVYAPNSVIANPPKTGGAPALLGWLTLAVCSGTLPLLRRRSGR